MTDTVTRAEKSAIVDDTCARTAGHTPGERPASTATVGAPPAIPERHAGRIALPRAVGSCRRANLTWDCLPLQAIRRSAMVMPQRAPTRPRSPDPTTIGPARVDPIRVCDDSGGPRCSSASSRSMRCVVPAADRRCGSSPRSRTRRSPCGSSRASGFPRERLRSHPPRRVTLHSVGLPRSKSAGLSIRRRPTTSRDPRDQVATRANPEIRPYPDWRSCVLELQAAPHNP